MSWQNIHATKTQHQLFAWDAARAGDRLSPEGAPSWPEGAPSWAGHDPVWVADQSGHTPDHTEDGPLLIDRASIGDSLACYAYMTDTKTVIECVVRVWCERSDERSRIILAGSSLVYLAKRWGLPIVLRASGIDLRWHPEGDEQRTQAAKRAIEAARDDAVSASAIAHKAADKAQEAAREADAVAQRLSLALSAL